MGGSIIRRIIAGFGIVLALALVIGAVGITSLTRARTANVEVTRQVLFDDVLTREIEDRFLRAETHFLRTLLEPSDAVARAARVTEIGEARKTAATLRDSAGNAEVRRVALALDSLLAAWDNASAQSAASASAGRREEAEQFRVATIAPLTDAILRHGREASGREEVESRQLIQASQQAIHTATNLLWIVTIATLLAGVFSSWLIIRSITRPLRESTNILATSSAEILAATSEQASGANESMAAVAQTAATVDQVAQTTEQAAQRARSVAEGAQRATEIGRNGRAAVDASIAVMQRVVEQVDSMRSGIRVLAEQAELIRGLTATVDEISERSNLLALNAAIEAARAGEEGRGFAVVAGEIRSLAEQSKRATVEVRGILGDIQRAAASAASVAEEGGRQARESARTVTEAGETIRQLGETIGESSQAAAQIAASAGQQATGMAQIRQAMRNIREVTQQNLVATQQTERAAKDLSMIGSKLVDLVGGRQKSQG